MSTSFTRGRASRLASSCPKDFDFEFFVFADEAQHPDWWSCKGLKKHFYKLHDNTAWNCVICLIAFFGIVQGVLSTSSIIISAQDIIYNLIYFFHMMVMVFEYRRAERIKKTMSKKLGIILDILTYVHYLTYFFTITKVHYNIQLTCYYLRLHRPFRYLFALTDSNLKGSVVGTALKYMYFFAVAKLTFAIICMENYQVKYSHFVLRSDEGPEHSRSARQADPPQLTEFDKLARTREGRFLIFLYFTYKLFCQIGLEYTPENNFERALILTINLTGCLLAAGAAVASLALVISLYMRPEEAFRARFRLIMKDLVDTHVAIDQRQRVETFYRMYWHKQRAVSVTQLLPLFPPTLPASIYTDIYFEAQQKSEILRDLSYMFLWEVAKMMETIHYIPGDAIIGRNSNKSSIIYISYGDVEMLTAEDDDTPILRMTRGSIISPCGGVVSMACGRSLVGIRAATFCTAHVLRAADLWRVALKYGKHNGQVFIILSAFEERIEKVKRHFRGRTKHPVMYKSSILQFKRNLIALKEARNENGDLLLARSDFFLDIAGCYIMRNRADSSLTEESDDICLRPTFPCILQPQSSMLFAWNGLVSFIIIVVAVVHPHYLVYTETVPLNFRFFDYVVTGIFIMDIFVYLSTGAKVEEGVPITFSQTSSQQIQSVWFIVDVLATLPIFELIGNGHFAGINKLLRLPKVFRVLKSMEEVNMDHSNVMKLLSYTLMIFLASYLTAATNHGFKCFREGKCLVLNFTHAPHWVQGAADDSTLEAQKTFGFFWSLSVISLTSHMTHRLSHLTRSSIIFLAVLLEVCAIMHILMDAMYSATIMVTTAMRDEFESCIENVKNFLISNKMDPTLRKRFIQYLQLCWYTDKAYAITHGKRSIYYDLPTHVHQDIFARQRNKYILCVPVLQLLQGEQLNSVSAHARLFYTSPNEILLNTGDINNEVYIIKRGFCEIYDPDSKTVIASITEKDHFGLLECLLRFPAFYTVRAVTHVQIFSISRKYLHKLIESPRVSDAIEFAKKSPEYTRAQMRRDPFLYYLSPPAATSLQRFPIPRKFQPDTAFTHPFTNLGFFSFLRYIFPRFTIRPDGKYIMRYEWFRGVCAMAISMLAPLYYTVELQWPKLYDITVCLDITAYYDMFQRLLVGYYNEKGILVYHPASTAAHYFKGPFLLDMIACLPLENLESNYEKSTRFSKVADITYSEAEIKQILLFNRLLQLYRLPSAMEVLSNHIHRRDILLVIKAIPLFVVLINVVTSLMIISSLEIFAKHTLNASDSSWPPWVIQLEKDPGGSWLELFSGTFRFNLTESPWNVQLATYFFVVYETTTTGYNYFLPSNIRQMRILIMGMFVGVMITTYFSVMVISIRANVNKVLADYQENMKDIVMFMRRENMDKNLNKDVLSYYEHNWVKVGGLDYRHVLKLCDQISLRTDAILHIYGNTFSKCPILYHCDISLLRVMGRAVHSLYFQNDTVVIEKDDVITDMYFIDYGSVEMRDIKDTSSTVTKLPKGSVFGNLDPTATYRCAGQFTATSDVHLLQINSLMFHKIILDFPTVKVLMKKYRPHNENYIVGMDGFGGSLLSVRMSRMSLQYSRRKTGALLVGGGTFGMIYVIFICMACVFGDIYNAGFNDNSIAVIIALNFLDILFVMKILVNTILQFFMEEGEARDNTTAATRKYLKTEFKVELLSVVPLELFCLVADESRWRLYSWLRLNRLLRLVTVSKNLQQHNKKLTVNLVYTTVLSVAMWFALFIHSLTCVWYLIGEIEDYRSPGSSWRNINPAINKYGCPDMYFCSFYFVLATVTENSVNDVMPMTQGEVIFVTLLQILSTLIYMIYLGEFSNIIQYQSYRSFGFYCKYLELQEFLKNNRVSMNLTKLVKRYSLHLWRENRGLQVPEFVTNAPNCLRLKLMSAAYLHHFEGSQTFKSCEKAFLRQLVGCLVLYTYCPDIFVAKEGEITDAMYLVHRGVVREVDEDMDEDETHRGAAFGPGDFFGITQGLVRNTPFTYSYQTTHDSQVLTLRLKTWEYLLKHFPRSRYAIFKDFPDHPHNIYPSQDEMEETGKVKMKDHALFKPLSVPLKSGSTKGQQGQWPVRDRRRSTVYGLPYPQDESDTDLTEHRVFSAESFAGVASDSTVVEKAKPDNETDMPPPMQRRKTFFEKMTESTKKLLKKQSFQGEDYEEGLSAKEILKFGTGDKDALTLAKDLKATKALLGKMEGSDDKEHFTLSSGRADKYYDEDEATSSQKMEGRSVRLASKDEKEDDGEDRSTFYEKRAPRLSFLPGLVQSETENKSDDEDKSTFNEKRAPRLSFLPGLVHKEDEAEAPPATSQRAPRRSIIAGLVPKDDKKERSTQAPTDFVLPKFLRRDDDYTTISPEQDDRQREKTVVEKERQQDNRLKETVIEIERDDQKDEKSIMSKEVKKDTIIEIKEESHEDRRNEPLLDAKEEKQKAQQIETIIGIEKVTQHAEITETTIDINEEDQKNLYEKKYLEVKEEEQKDKQKTMKLTEEKDENQLTDNKIGEKAISEHKQEEATTTEDATTTDEEIELKSENYEKEVTDFLKTSEDGTLTEDKLTDYQKDTTERKSKDENDASEEVTKESKDDQKEENANKSNQDDREQDATLSISNKYDNTMTEGKREVQEDSKFILPKFLLKDEDKTEDIQPNVMPEEKTKEEREKQQKEMIVDVDKETLDNDTITENTMTEGKSEVQEEDSKFILPKFLQKDEDETEDIQPNVMPKEKTKEEREKQQKEMIVDVDKETLDNDTITEIIEDKQKEEEKETYVIKAHDDDDNLTPKTSEEKMDRNLEEKPVPIESEEKSSEITGPTALKRVKRGGLGRLSGDKEIYAPVDEGLNRPGTSAGQRDPETSTLARSEIKPEEEKQPPPKQ